MTRGWPSGHGRQRPGRWSGRECDVRGEHAAGALALVLRRAAPRNNRCRFWPATAIRDTSTRTRPPSGGATDPAARPRLTKPPPRFPPPMSTRTTVSTTCELKSRTARVRPPRCRVKRTSRTSYPESVRPRLRLSTKMSPCRWSSPRSRIRALPVRRGHQRDVHRHHRLGRWLGAEPVTPAVTAGSQGTATTGTVSGSHSYDLPEITWSPSG